MLSTLILGALLLLLLLLTILLTNMLRRLSEDHLPLKPGQESLRIVLSTPNGPVVVPPQPWIKLPLPLPEPHYNKPVIPLVTYGTRGDVQPLIALALSLQRLSKFNVYICAPGKFRAFVQSFGVTFHGIGSLEHVPQPRRIFEAKKSRFTDVIEVLGEVYAELAQGVWEVLSKQGCDFIISGVFTRSICWHIAEKLHVPCWALHLAPSDSPTFNFPPPEFIDTIMSRRLPKWWTKLSYFLRSLQIIRAADRCGMVAHDQHFRKHVLGLEELPFGDSVNLSRYSLNLHAYSAAIQPKPEDWASWEVVTGFWQVPKLDSKAFVKEEVAQFLQRKPVMVTFGSMQYAIKLVEVVLQALLQLGHDVLLVAGGEELQSEVESRIWLKEQRDKVFIVKEIPYEEVLPSCRGIVHHGGAGTTASALYCAVPMLIIPLLQWSDQRYWASVITNCGCGTWLSRVEAEEAIEKVKAAIIKALGCGNGAGICAKKLELRDAGTTIAAKLIADYYNALRATS